jgi:hypothetical protein
MTRKQVKAAVKRRRGTVEGYRRGAEGAPRGPSPFGGNPPVRASLGSGVLGSPDQQDRQDRKRTDDLEAKRNAEMWNRLQRLFKQNERRRYRERMGLNNKQFV